METQPKGSGARQKMVSGRMATEVNFGGSTPYLVTDLSKCFAGQKLAVDADLVSGGKIHYVPEARCWLTL